MKIRIHNHYEQMHSCMLGDIDFSVLNSVNKNKRDRLQFVFEQTYEDLNNYQKQLESYGIDVFRPRKLDSSKNLITPYYETIGHRIPINVSDSFFVVDNTIIETASWTPEAVFTGMYWRDVTRAAFKNGANWLPMPMPLHNKNEIDPLDNDIPNLDPIIDGPCFYLHNEIVLVSSRGANNQLGIEWIKRQFTDKKFIHLNPKIFIGHLDSHLNILRPGLIVTWHSPDDFPEYFKNWDFIIIEPLHPNGEFIDSRIQDDDHSNTVLMCNSLSINQNTILVETTAKYTNNTFLKELEKHKMNIEFVKYEWEHFFGQGLTCITKPLHRED